MSARGELDEWERELEILAADIDPADIERLNSALKAADHEGKDLVRREMGLK